MLQKLLPFKHHDLWSPLPCAKLHLLSCVSIFEALLWQGMEYMFVSPTCIISEFQNLSFCPLRRNCLMSLLVFFTIVQYMSLPLILSLLQSQPIFVSFIAILSVLCCCFKAMSLVGILTQQGSFFHFQHQLFNFIHSISIYNFTIASTQKYVDLARAKSEALFNIIVS